MLNENLSFRY